MSYSILANSASPALILYILDVSGSMKEPLGRERRIDVVTKALDHSLRVMIFRSTKGRIVSPRYRLGILAYSDDTWDLLDGFKPVNEVAKTGVPILNPRTSTETAKAFQLAERMLRAELPYHQGCPAPLVCHMTDGEYTGADPGPIAQRIMGLSVPDGNVLVENIFISDKLLGQPIPDPFHWPGITRGTPLGSSYAEKLRGMSSPLPESYRKTMAESNYRLDPNAVMLLPGTSPELVGMGFALATATPYAGGA